MNSDRHLFICDQAELLPRWREAFPSAAQTGGVAASGDEPAAVVWLRLHPGSPAQDQLQQVRRRFGTVPCVVLSDTPHDAEAAAIFAAGAKGYCNTHASSEMLQQVASVVLQGGLWIGTDMMQRLLAVAAHVPPSPATARGWEPLLSDREREVAHEISAGASNKEIARRLGITERTVKMHVGAIFAKLKVRDRLQLSILLKK